MADNKSSCSVNQSFWLILLNSNDMTDTQRGFCVDIAEAFQRLQVCYQT